MSIWARLRRRKRAVATATVMSLVLSAVVALSISYEGVATADVEMNDGGVWVSNNESVLVGRLNYPIGEIDATLAALGQDVDLLQRGDVVFVEDRASNGLQRVDPAGVAAQGSMVALPGDSDVQLGEQTLGVLVEETGAWRVLGLDELGVLEESSEEPQAVLGQGAAQAVADDGTAFGLSVQDGELLRFDAGARSEPTVVQMDEAGLAGQVQLTAVGQEPVALAYDRDDESLLLSRPEAEPVDLSGLDVDGDSARLQEPSKGGEGVVFATSDALVRVPLDGGEPRVVRPQESGEPAAPVQASGCAHGAWSAASSSYLRVCGEGDPQPQEVPEATGGELTFRENHGYVVLNELSTGNSWMIEDALILVDNWEENTPPTDEEKEEEEESEDLQQQEVQLDREAENRDPVAKPDSYGVRAGGTAVLPVLDNDSDADGDLLTVSEFDEVEESFGRVEPILGGRALQVRVADDAGGSASFEYTVEDGRGGSDTASVDLSVHAPGQNGAPEQKRDMEARITRGASTDVNVLDHVLDPDGDEVYVTEAVDSAGLDVQANPKGEVTITDPGVDPGVYQVRVGVSDGRADSEVVIEVEVLPDSAQPPEAVFDYETAFAGETIEVDPLANDKDPNDRPLRLANVRGADGAQVQLNGDDETFSFSADSAGDYYTTYVVADDDGLSDMGLVRIQVREAQQEDPIAVGDTALLPPGGAVLTDVLENDFDPAGGVLAVQGISVPQGYGLHVGIMHHRILRISSDRALPEPVTIEYTVSNGTSSSEGEVEVLPLQVDGKYEPPVAESDSVRVRAGDHVTIPVLANDSHPNGLEFELDDELDQEPDEGLMFTAGEMVRYKAPDEAGTYQGVYSVTDENGRQDSARITVNVQARADGANGAPEPEDVRTRAFAGERIRIPIQTYGIDPDGDSVELLGLDTGPGLGRIVEVGPTYIDYQAYTDSAGTDEFSYAVRDRLGAMSTAEVTVGVIPPPSTNRDPVTVADEISVRPDRPVSVDVLANDTDPDGDQLMLGDPAFGEVDEGIEPRAKEGKVAFTSPSEAGTYLVEYVADDGHGGTAPGVLTVEVDPDSEPQPPVAVDDVVPPSAIVDRTEVEVDVLDNDTDPDGTAEALRVSIPEGQDNARVVDDQVEVTLTDQRQVVIYQVTDPDELSSYAFIEVPGLTDTGPVLRSDVEPIKVESGQSEQIELNDYVVSLSGDPVQLANTTTVQATNSDGADPVVDASTIQYTSAQDYTGPATVTFEVTDAEDINDDDILTSVLTLPIEVYSKDNQPPKMRNGSARAEAGGEEVTLDLARLAEDPDGRSTDLTYDISEQADGFEASVDGYILTVRADRDTDPGTVAELPITVTDGESDPVSASVELTATASNEPLIVTNPDDAGEVAQGRPTSIEVLANDSNPFPGEPLELVSAEVTEGDGTADVSGDGVQFTPAEDYVGRMSITYTVADATGDPDREVEGTVTAAVLGAPEAPSIPLVEEVGNHEVSLDWRAPDDNGAPISGYTVEYEGGSQSCSSTTCTIGGLNNGSTYTFSVTATNEVGESPASSSSDEATPDVRPEAPGVPSVDYGDGELNLDWSAPENEGSPITSYDVRISPSPGKAQESVSGTSMTWTGLENGTNYTFQVRAINDAPDPGKWSQWSGAEHPSGPPAQPGAPKATRIDDAAGGRLQVDWSAPDANGDAVSGYELAMYRDGDKVQTFTPGGGTTSREVQVKNDHDYSFTVMATNRSGDSEVSAKSESVTSFGAPGRVGDVSAKPTGADRTAKVSHAIPSNNGQKISRYEYRIGGGSAKSLPSNGEITVGNNGKDYTVQVRACNTYCGNWSAASNSFSTYGKPGNSSLSIDTSVKDKKVSFSWSNAGSDNGANITGGRYRIDGGSWSNFSGTSGSASTTGDWSEKHKIEVQLENEHGQRSKSKTANATADKKPEPENHPSVTMRPGGSAVGEYNCNHQSCAYLSFDYEDLKAGEYTIKFFASGEGDSAWRTYTETLGKSGNYESTAVRGFPGETVRVEISGPSGTLKDSITWPDS